MTQEEFHKRYQYNPNTDCLGEGGFGKVFKAYDTHRDRWVAIKMAEVKPQLEEVRLKKEVEMIKKLPTHPNIAYYEECYTFSTFAGEYDFGILQYYEQGNLQELLIANQLTDRQKDSLLRQILEGIGFLHSQGIIHRDIKPQNILIVNRNGEYVPKITDFGISKRLDTNKSSVFTNSIAGAGTLAYASPEQLLGQTIKKNTDLWSFGVIVYWVFLGKLPFNTGDMTVTSEAGRIELFKQITKGEIPGLVNQLNSPWNEIVKKCLLADNEKRLANTSECSLLLGGKTIIENEPKTLFENQILESEPVANDIKIEETRIKSSFKVSYPFVAIFFVVLIFIIWKNSDPSSTPLKSEVAQIVPEGIKVKDIDGNEYHTITIGSQIWMVENLKTTRYNDGTSIANVTDDLEWSRLSSGAYCWYNNNAARQNTSYGALYNWYAVKSDKLAPKGWHVPSDSEWVTLYNYLGGANIAGNKLKKTIDLNSGFLIDFTINEHGFSALLPGYRMSTGEYKFSQQSEFWWTSTESKSDRAVSLCIYDIYSDISIGKNNPKSCGLSIRCVKNN